DYRLMVDLIVLGGFNFSKARCRILFKVDGRERLSQEFGWQNGKRSSFPVEEKLEPGEHKLEFELQPLIPEGLRPPTQPNDQITMRMARVGVQGPLDPKLWVTPKNFALFFSQDEPPADPAERHKYTREVMRRFATRAFRRPTDDRTVARLTAIAEGV